MFNSRTTLTLSVLIIAMTFVFASFAFAGSQGKKALLIVAKEDFEQSEYNKVREAFDDGGLISTIASTKKGTLKGNKGKRIESDLLLSEVIPADYDAVVVIGGNGIKKIWKDEDAHRIIAEAAEQGKIIGAICAAPGVLAYSGVLNGKKATANPNSGANNAIRSNGCEYVNQRVVIDGKIITANGPAAAAEFGQAIVEALN